MDFKRLGCVNLVVWEVPAGRYDLESFEPYTLRYLKVILLGGDLDLEAAWIREYGNPEAFAGTFRSSDPRLEKLFAAGRQTFRQNAVDIFMDCPSRERAGWLCDSFFTSRVAPDLCGTTSQSSRPSWRTSSCRRSSTSCPTGMLPMCYPADHNDGVFIPNWAHVVRGGAGGVPGPERRPATGGRARPRVEALLDSSRSSRNSDGLLEKLPSWVFVEWSKANELRPGRELPLEHALRWHPVRGRPTVWAQGPAWRKPEKVRSTVRAQSFDGTFFVDNALRKRMWGIQ